MNDFPSPSGVYKIGTKVYNWTDESRNENFTEDLLDKRKIVVQIWYPLGSEIINKSHYLDNPNKRIMPIAQQFDQLKISPKLISLLISDVKNIKTNSELDAELSTDVSTRQFPLLLFSHGLGGMRMQNTIQIEELVSQGYVVIAPDHAYDANITIFNDDKVAEFKSSEYDETVEYSVEDFYSYRIPQLNTRVSDLSFIINKISELKLTSNENIWEIINLDKIGVFGHSFGGGTGLVSMHNDDNIDACVLLDGWIEPIPTHIISSGIQKPFLYIGQVAWEDTLNYFKLDQLIDNSNLNGSKIFLPGTKHFDYTDTPYFNNIIKNLGVSGSMPTETIVDTLNYHLRLFFNEHLYKN